MHRRNLLLTSLVCAAAFAATPATVRADTYPTKPIRIVVGYAAGGATDVIARIVGQKLAEELGQPVVVENRPGAGASIGSDFVAKSAPDGYTLFMGTIANTINTTLYRRLPFDFERDFAPISLVATVPNVMVVNPSVPAKTVQEFIALAKAKPNEIYFASSGSGSSIHLSGELFNMVAGVKMVHVPYKGSAPAVIDLMGGQVQAMFDNLSSSLPHVKAGKLRALAVTSATRSPAAPDIPTMAEAGLPDCEVLSWFALMAPAKTPQPIIDRLNAATVKLLGQDDVKQKLDAIGADPAPSTPQELGALIRSETAKWAKVVENSGAKVD
jgi:tripartite-type tricarboxylate transporter receptor subunit TctC